jgi:hypothetical protein
MASRHSKVTHLQPPPTILLEPLTPVRSSPRVDCMAGAANEKALAGRLIRLHRFSPLGPSGEGFSRVCNLPQRFPFKFFRRLSISPNLHGTTIEEGTTLNGKRRMLGRTI